jgi:hypothetical protein
MIITITSIKKATKTSKAGNKYKVTSIMGNKWASEEEWGTDIPSFKNELIEQLEDFAVGDVANFKFDTSGRWPELEEILDATTEDLEKAQEAVDNPYDGDKGKGKGKGGGKRTSGKSSGGSQKTSSSAMSKAEWAAKDVATKESIARAVALKLAVENTKESCPVPAILKQAVKYMPFLLGEDEILFDKVKDPEDALDPPVED